VESKGNEYFAYIEKTGVKDIRSVQGNRGVLVMRHVSEGRAEFLVISMWESFDAIRKFAGPDIEKAVYYPEDKEFLLELEPKVTHYEVLVELGKEGVAPIRPRSPPVQKRRD